jgi:putative addiction module component (TIGR02574 family)
MDVREDSKMSDLQSILSSAMQLTVDERLKLIDAIWETVPSTALPPLSEEWRAEIQRRSAELDAGTAATIPWTDVRDEAFRRNGIDAGN